jgi:non-ribosomal peptide synthetase component F
MAIEMAGFVYCPLSPQDPQERLQTLVEQTRCRLALVHAMTIDKFNLVDSKIGIQSFDSTSDLASDVSLDRLSTDMTTGESIAYAIFTSGSTGIPKAVS